MSLRLPRYLCCALLTLALPLHGAAADIGTLSDPQDAFVLRARPERATLFAKGELGILLPSYGRAPLFEAYRALSLDRTVLERENQQPPREDSSGEDAALPGWLAERKALNAAPARREIDLYRQQSADSPASFVNCTPGAFVLATGLLGQLRQDTSVGAEQVREWLDAQDAVFEFCTHVPGTAGAPALPAPLAATAPLRLRQLRQYQQAAAQFYAGQYPAAQAAFAAIAAAVDHPLRHWAALADLRSTLREASLDLAWARQYADINRQAPDAAARDSALSAAASQRAERRQAAMQRMEARAQALLADPQWAQIHAAVRTLMRQAIRMLQPWRALGAWSAELEQLARNPYAQNTLSLWEDVADRLLDFGPPGPDVTPLRQRFVFFDWIRTIQGCTDNPLSPNFTGRCEQEHAHALDQWARLGTRPWLVAALVTAQQANPANQAALDAALRALPDSPGWLTLHYHAARALRTAGRNDQARAVLERALARGHVQISSVNLLSQQRVALGTSVQDVLPFLVRKTVNPRAANNPGLGADGDELLNRQLTSESLLALAQAPATAAPLARHLALAAWFRADLAGKPDVADQAARYALTAVPTLRAELERYLAQTSAADKQASLLLTAFAYQVSPLVLRGTTAQLAQPRRRGTPADAWCSFDHADAAKAQRVERMLALPPLGIDGVRRDAELAALAAVGSGAQWFARQALAFVKSHPGERNNARMLQAVLASVDNHSCPHPQAEAVRRQAQALLVSP